MKSSKVLAAVACLILLNLTLVSGSCEKDQVNINKASKSELQKIKWIGPSTANSTVNSRPFNSLDDLKDVKYLGDEKVKDIKNQSLACLENNKKDSSKQEEPDEQDKKKSEDKVKEREDSENEDSENKKTRDPEKQKEPKKEDLEQITREKSKNKPKKPIKLNTKDIKNQTNTEDSRNKKNYTKYGLTGITVLVILLFLAREIKHQKKYKNEFSG